VFDGSSVEDGVETLAGDAEERFVWRGSVGSDGTDSKIGFEEHGEGGDGDDVADRKWEPCW
jgi:hypothetical protein